MGLLNGAVHLDPRGLAGRDVHRAREHRRSPAGRSGVDRGELLRRPHPRHRYLGAARGRMCRGDRGRGHRLLDRALGRASAAREAWRAVRVDGAEDEGQSGAVRSLRRLLRLRCAVSALSPQRRRCASWHPHHAAARLLYREQLSRDRLDHRLRARRLFLRRSIRAHGVACRHVVRAARDRHRDRAADPVLALRATLAGDGRVVTLGPIATSAAGACARAPRSAPC